MATQLLQHCQRFEEYRDKLITTHQELYNRYFDELDTNERMEIYIAGAVTYCQLNSNMVTSITSDLRLAQEVLTVNHPVVTLLFLMMRGLTDPIQHDDTTTDPRCDLFNQTLDRGFDLLDTINVQAYRYRRATRQIQRWWRHQYYRPGRPGYHQAQDHFRSLS
jgi:hypothetical protein